MNKEKLKELAATLNGIAEGKAWEYKGLDWFSPSMEPMYYIGKNTPIRLKPWSLPPPPEGQQWHRSDGWTEEMLPNGWRPLLDGEMRQKQDEAYIAMERRWVACELYYRRATPTQNHLRTRRPLPQPQQPDPYAEIKAAHAAGKTIQALSVDGKWRDWVGGDDFAPREPSNLRIKPETRRVNANPVRIPLCADDIKSGDEFLAPDGNRRQWERISDKGISFVWAYASWSELKQNGWKIRSIGETEWRECSKEEEVEA